jgi:hypothetical protein
VSLNKKSKLGFKESYVYIITTMPSSKMSRPGAEDAQVDSFDSFDFGEPDVIPVEISKGKFLYLKEPCAEDLIHIAEINDNEKLGEIEATLQTICVLHHPEEGGKKLSMKDAKKLTARHLKKIGDALATLLGGDE